MQYHILEYLEETAVRLPDKAAFVNDRESLTFRELCRGANRIAGALAARQARREPILIYMEKSPRAIQACFGVLGAGCCYVPLDPHMPAGRVELMIARTQAKRMICDEQSAGQAARLNFAGETVLLQELLAQEEDKESLAQIRESTLDTDPAYIFFTSGSTGTPAGVVGHHRGVIDYIDQLSEVLFFDEETVFGSQTPLYFDASMKEIFSTIKCGATTYLIPEGLFVSPVKLVEYLNAHKINTICWVVSALTMVSAFGTFDVAKPEYLKTVAFGGEVFPVRQFHIWKEALPDASFINLYGPTECTGVCCYYRADTVFDETAVIPIGRPFRNTQILLLGEDAKEAARGETGEICIRGTGVTHGYYNDRERTRERFVQNPLNPFYPDIIYRTGDLGKYNEDGELVFLSRKDYQIKHMGHRIELGEIDAAVDTMEGIQACCSIYAGADDKIVLFYVGEPDRKQVAVRLKELLPRYMLPNVMIKVDALRYTLTGKPDRPALERLYMQKKENRRTGR